MLFQVTPTVDRGRRLPQHGLVAVPLVIITLGIIIVVCGDPQEAVSFAVCVPVVSRDRPRRVHGLGLGVCGARGIE